MESILLTTKYVELYILLVAVLAMLGGAVIAILHELIREQVRESRISTQTAVEEPTEGSARMQV